MFLTGSLHLLISAVYFLSIDDCGIGTGVGFTMGPSSANISMLLFTGRQKLKVWLASLTPKNSVIPEAMIKSEIELIIPIKYERWWKLFLRCGRGPDWQVVGRKWRVCLQSHSAEVLTRCPTECWSRPMPSAVGQRRRTRDSCRRCVLLSTDFQHSSKSLDQSPAGTPAAAACQQQMIHTVYLRPKQMSQYWRQLRFNDRHNEQWVVSERFTVINRNKLWHSLQTVITSHSQPFLQWVKKIPPTVFWNFFPNCWEFLINFLHTYYVMISTLDYKFLFNYLQLWQSYGILSTTT